MLDELTREGTVVAAFQATHNKFRQFHGDFLRLAPLASSSGEASEELRRSLDAYAALFHEHHEAEDRYLFPVLRRQEYALEDVVDELEQQHVRLAAQLAMVLDGVGSPNSAALAQMPQLTKQLRELTGMVDEHLQFEEHSTIPLISQWTSWPL
jgi:hemerythrin-like domain-containing protein